jgi:membrane protein implicated in regulation of membrane protease activity
MKKQIGAAAIILGLVLGVANPAAAYVGPGAGLSLLGAFWGLLLAVGAALGFVILWPLRRMLKRRKGTGSAAVPQPQAQAAKVSHDGSSTPASS